MLFLEQYYFRVFFRRNQNLPVIMTSERLVPKMRLANLPPAASRPLPYEGKAFRIGYSFKS